MVRYLFGCFDHWILHSLNAEVEFSWFLCGSQNVLRNNSIACFTAWPPLQTNLYAGFIQQASRLQPTKCPTFVGTFSHTRNSLMQPINCDIVFITIIRTKGQISMFTAYWIFIKNFKGKSVSTSDLACGFGIVISKCWFIFLF